MRCNPKQALVFSVLLLGCHPRRCRLQAAMARAECSHVRSEMVALGYACNQVSWGYACSRAGYVVHFYLSEERCVAEIQLIVGAWSSCPWNVAQAEAARLRAPPRANWRQSTSTPQFNSGTSVPP